MSEHWDLKCLDCDMSFGVDWNHGRDDLVSIWNDRDTLVAAHELAKRGGGVFDIEVTHFGDRINTEFLQTHATHNVRAVNEFGEIDGRCNKRLTCACCGKDAKCVLDHGHDGACAPKTDPLSELERLAPNYVIGQLKKHNDDLRKALEYTVATLDNCMPTMREADSDEESDEVEEELVEIRKLLAPTEPEKTR